MTGYAKRKPVCLSSDNAKTPMHHVQPYRGRATGEERVQQNDKRLDKSGLKNYRRKSTHLSLAWIDYKNVYSVLPQFW